MIPGPVLAYAREANDGPSPSIHGCQSLARYGFSSSKLGRSLWMSVSIACSLAALSSRLAGRGALDTAIHRPPRRFGGQAVYLILGKCTVSLTGGASREYTLHRRFRQAQILRRSRPT